MTYRDQGNDLRTNAGSTRTVTGPLGITATDDGSTVTFYTRDPSGTILDAHTSTSRVRSALWDCFSAALLAEAWAWLPEE